MRPISPPLLACPCGARAARLPGSWGYYRDQGPGHDLPKPPEPNAFIAQQLLPHIVHHLSHTFPGEGEAIAQPSPASSLSLAPHPPPHPFSGAMRVAGRLGGPVLTPEPAGRQVQSRPVPLAGAGQPAGPREPARGRRVQTRGQPSSATTMPPGRASCPPPRLVLQGRDGAGQGGGKRRRLGESRATAGATAPPPLPLWRPQSSGTRVNDVFLAIFCPRHRCAGNAAAGRARRGGRGSPALSAPQPQWQQQSAAKLSMRCGGLAPGLRVRVACRMQSAFALMAPPAPPLPTNSYAHTRGMRGGKKG